MEDEAAGTSSTRSRPMRKVGFANSKKEIDSDSSDSHDSEVSGDSYSELVEDSEGPIRYSDSSRDDDSDGSDQDPASDNSGNPEDEEQVDQPEGEQSGDDNDADSDFSYEFKEGDEEPDLRISTRRKLPQHIFTFKSTGVRCTNCLAPFRSEVRKTEHEQNCTGMTDYISAFRSFQKAAMTYVQDPRLHISFDTDENIELVYISKELLLGKIVNDDLRKILAKLYDPMNWSLAFAWSEDSCRVLDISNRIGMNVLTVAQKLAEERFIGRWVSLGIILLF